MRKWMARKVGNSSRGPRHPLAGASSSCATGQCRRLRKRNFSVGSLKRGDTGKTLETVIFGGCPPPRVAFARLGVLIMALLSTYGQRKSTFKNTQTIARRPCNVPIALSDNACVCVPASLVCVMMSRGRLPCTPCLVGQNPGMLPRYQHLSWRTHIERIVEQPLGGYLRWVSRYVVGRRCLGPIRGI